MALYVNLQCNPYLSKSPLYFLQLLTDFEFFVDNPDLVSDNPTVIVYSSVAYILQNVSNIEDIDGMTIDQFSALVNTGNSNNSIDNVNGAEDRRNRYNNLIQDENLFECENE